MRLLSLAAGLLLLSNLTAADPLTEAARQAVAARKVRDSDVKGSRSGLAPYRELAADGGVLVGLEVGLGVSLVPLMADGSVTRGRKVGVRGLAGQIRPIHSGVLTRRGDELKPEAKAFVASLEGS